MGDPVCCACKLKVDRHEVEGIGPTCQLLSQLFWLCVCLHVVATEYSVPLHWRNNTLQSHQEVLHFVSIIGPFNCFPELGEVVDKAFLKLSNNNKVARWQYNVDV